jgi:hypothetical protein
LNIFSFPFCAFFSRAADTATAAVLCVEGEKKNKK